MENLDWDELFKCADAYLAAIQIVLPDRSFEFGAPAFPAMAENASIIIANAGNLKMDQESKDTLGRIEALLAEILDILKKEAIP
jgi:hypothetical protein